MASEFLPKFLEQGRCIMTSRINVPIGDLDSSIDSSFYLEDPRPNFAGTSISSTIKQDDSNAFISQDEELFDPTPEKENINTCKMSILFPYRQLNLVKKSQQRNLRL